MRITIKISLLISQIIILSGCAPEKPPVNLVDQNESLVWEQSIDDVRSEQKLIIANIYKPEEELRLEYYNDSIVKMVESMENGREFGYKLEFRESGKLNRKTFIDRYGKEVGDESLFNLAGEIRDHLYKDRFGNYLFHMKYSKGKVTHVEGRPWYIIIPQEVKLGDTAVFSISCPLVPGYTTHVEFGIADDTTSTIRYINDIRQMRIKLHMKKVELVKHKLKVVIKSENQQIVVEDSTIISTNVVP
jgi:hypothetical protein